MIWRKNPLTTVPQDCFEVVDLWLQCRRLSASSMFGKAVPTLPCAGSVGEQPAALLDAFAMLDQWTQEA